METSATAGRRPRSSNGTAFRALILAAGLIGVGAQTGQAATPAPARPAARPAVASNAAARLSGIWVSRNKSLPEGPAAGFPIQLSSTEWTPLSGGNVETMAIETYDHQQAAVEKVIANNGDVFVYERSRHPPVPFSAAGQKATQDAAAERAASKKPRDPYDQCLPRNNIGFALGGGFGSAMEIFVAGDHVGVISESGEYRMVRMGKVAPGQFTPTYNGVSTGRWQGDRLVITTTDFLGSTAGAWPMSDKAKVTDTIWVAANGRTLNIKTVYEDSVNMKEPLARMSYLDRAKPNYEFLPNNCVEGVQGAAEYAATFGSAPPK